MAIVSAKAIAANTLTTKPDGTGPFKFASYSPNNSFVVSANTKYWGGAPKLGQITFRTIPDEQSIGSAVQAGTVQIGLLTEPQVVQQLQGQSLTTDKVLALNYRALMIQSTGPFANVNARLAVQCAIDRKAVLQAAVLGGGKVVGPVPQGPFASNANSGVCAHQNLKDAKAYLAKNGTPSGFSFSVMTSEELDGTSTAQATTIQAELAQVGIQMNIDNLAGSAYIQNWLKGQFQATLAENGANPSPYIMYGRYFGTGASLKVPAGFSSPILPVAACQGRREQLGGGADEDLPAAQQSVGEQRGVGVVVQRLRLLRALVARARLHGIAERAAHEPGHRDHLLADWHRCRSPTPASPPPRPSRQARQRARRGGRGAVSGAGSRGRSRARSGR